jgi:lysophospholipase L1-like esterase
MCQTAAVTHPDAGSATGIATETETQDLPVPVPVPLSFVAIGDSFTEGLDDPAVGSRGGFRGWADRVAEQFASVEPAFAYANLAVRGRKLDQIIDGQLPRALELKPELVSLAGGTNDVLRPRVDLNLIGRRFQDAVRQLRENGSQVVLFQSVDPTPRSRLIGRALPRIKALTTIVEETAEQYQCVVVRLWSARIFAHPAMWSEDRLHLSSEGHERVAGAVLEALGLGDHAWSEDLDPYTVPPLRERLAADARWARDHFGPWVGRRMRGVSSGDAVSAKQPELGPVTWIQRDG